MSKREGNGFQRKAMGEEVLQSKNLAAGVERSYAMGGSQGLAKQLEAMTVIQPNEK